MIAPFIKWDHTEDYFVTKFSLQKGDYSGERKVTLSLEEESYIAGHIIDGKLLCLKLLPSQSTRQLNETAFFLLFVI